MNWDAVGAIGEVVGAVAVVATLGYLALQIRQSTKQARASAQRELNASYQAVIDRFREDPELFQLGCSDFHNLSRADQLRFDFMIAPVVVHLDQVIRMYNDGLESEDTVETTGLNALALLQSPGARHWYKTARPFVGFEARTYIDTRLNDPDNLPPAYVDVLPWHTPD